MQVDPFSHIQRYNSYFLRSGIVYKFKCGGCNGTYYGKTKRHFKVRMCEHLGVSALTGKKVIKEHLP